MTYTILLVVLVFVALPFGAAIWFLASWCTALSEALTDAQNRVKRLEQNSKPGYWQPNQGGVE